jgi:hypothetical protein
MAPAPADKDPAQFGAPRRRQRRHGPATASAAKVLRRELRRNRHDDHRFVRVHECLSP